MVGVLKHVVDFENIMKNLIEAVKRIFSDETDFAIESEFKN